jgi:hypothetical protein
LIFVDFTPRTIIKSILRVKPTTLDSAELTLYKGRSALPENEGGRTLGGLLIDFLDSVWGKLKDVQTTIANEPKVLRRCHGQQRVVVG